MYAWPEAASSPGRKPQQLPLHGSIWAPRLLSGVPKSDPARVLEAIPHSAHGDAKEILVMCANIYEEFLTSDAPWPNLALVGKEC